MAKPLSVLIGQVLHDQSLLPTGTSKAVIAPWTSSDPCQWFFDAGHCDPFLQWCLFFISWHGSLASP